MHPATKLIAVCAGALALIAATVSAATPANAHFYFRHGWAHPWFGYHTWYRPWPVFYRPYLPPPPPPVYVVPRAAYIPPPVVYGYGYGYGYGWRYHRVVHRHYRHVVHKVAVHHPVCACACCPK